MKIDVIRPAYRFKDPECDAAVQNMLSHMANSGIDIRMPLIRGHALPHRVRNEALLKIRADCDWVLWCDDDMFPAKDACEKLVQNADGEHIVSALTTTRDQWPPTLIPKAWRAQDDRFVLIPSEDWEQHLGKIMRGHFGVGFGFVITSKQILDEATEFYLSGKDWLELESKRLNRLHVRAENREKERKHIEQERRNRFEETGYLRVFGMSVQDNELERGEDVHFSRLVIAMGHHVSIDTTVQVPHMGKCPYGPNLLGVNDHTDLRVPEEARVA